jgi:Nuclear envelope localisation domain
MISKNLESTSHQLKSIQKSYQRLKLSRMRAAKRKDKQQLQTASNSSRHPTAGSRMRRTARAALSISLVLVLLLLLSWGAEPRCCDSYTSSTLSFSPQLKYVNGPPPI